ncbi:hypothetical protein HF206_14775 [Rhizobium leguminosarum]|nr:hypothetical protein [Rhizobium leguminosarum]MBY2970914.1 hypothetical protein [Rhizobium leguminosarum]MBY2977981.1 hypothetical protein [Rhizobium leguminosarum]MBY3006531.1 hypothetical protein [Rhizobium leguminosarum]
MTAIGGAFLPSESSSIIGGLGMDIAALTLMSIAPAGIKICREMLINRRQPVIKLGLSPELADILARQTVIGAGAMLESLPEDALDLRQNVISPGGTTKAALKVLMRKNGMQSLLDEAVTAAHARARPRSG